MRFEPHDYQQVAIDFVLEHPQAVLILEMGLGKTAITLAALNALLYDRFEAEKILIIAPKRVAQKTWPDEIRKWSNFAQLDYELIIGTKHDRERALTSPAPIHIINRENVPWLVKHLGNDWDYDTVVIDELSSFKSPQAQRFKALRAVRKRVTRMIGLTGTPAPNSLLDLFAQYRLIDDGARLGKFVTHYRERFFRPTRYVWGRPVGYQPVDGAEDEIYDLISDITLSMRTVDHLHLPEVTYTDRAVPIQGKARAAYEELRHELITDIGGQEIDALNAAVLSGKLLQLASGAIYTSKPAYAVVHDGKLDELEDIIEAANGQPVLVAYWYTHDRERILARFSQARVLDAEQDFTDWNAGAIQVGLIHPASAGHGLNLQAGGHILVWFSLTWSLELYQQTNARLHRQGQTIPVSIIHLVGEDTFDERVLEVLTRKGVGQAALVDAVKAELNQ
ncbi:DEAD/DEAH box helicase [Trueperella bernardiae]|uniref:DEAD/DEAH box helicase n=1 Tax=Trueperella bernardiae TaxID=59561 RepID=UPI0029495E80|nr:DEAD/DEAH box helicase [Trueperella bernardiae]MDV6239739.1 DEAD/DEAH box helicase [Trueperella bernardiae]